MKDVPPDRRSSLELYEEFRAAGERKARAQQAERSAERRRRFGLRGPVVGGVLGFLVVSGGVAVGTKVFVADDTPVVSDPSPTVQRRAPQDRRITQAVVDDPKIADARWGLRMYTDDRGATCLVPGRLVGGRVGRVDGGQFHPYTSDVPGVCTDMRKTHASILMRGYPIASDTRSILFGSVDRTVSEVAIERGGQRTSVPVAPDGTYLVVRVGDGSFAGERLQITTNGKVETTPLGPH